VSRASVLCRFVAWHSTRASFTLRTCFRGRFRRACDGHDYVAAAADLGAVAAVVERPAPGVALLQIVVDDTRRALGIAAAWWYGDPSRDIGNRGCDRHRRKDDDGIPGCGCAEGRGNLNRLVTTAEVARGLAAGPPTRSTLLRPRPRSCNGCCEPWSEPATRLRSWDTSHGLALHRVAEVAYDVAVFTKPEPRAPGAARHV